ncbi:MAG: RDD family protein [Actinomycetota bacterium]|nr:RDD family protein [Actinomycetota bacterium]
MSAWWRRVGAYLIDAIIVGVPLTILDVALSIGSIAHTVSCSPPGSSVSSTCVSTRFGIFSGGFLLLEILGVVVTAIYFGLLDGSARGQTVGKMAAGIVLRDADSGGPVGFWRAAARPVLWTLFFYLFFVPGVLNFLWAAWDSRHQCWHDKIVRTTVARVW